MNKIETFVFSIRRNTTNKQNKQLELNYEDKDGEKLQLSGLPKAIYKHLEYVLNDLSNE